MAGCSEGGSVEWRLAEKVENMFNGHRYHGDEREIVDEDIRRGSFPRADSGGLEEVVDKGGEGEGEMGVK